MNLGPPPERKIDAVIRYPCFFAHSPICPNLCEDYDRSNMQTNNSVEKRSLAHVISLASVGRLLLAFTFPRAHMGHY